MGLCGSLQLDLSRVLLEHRFESRESQNLRVRGKQFRLAPGLTTLTVVQEDVEAGVETSAL